MHNLVLCVFLFKDTLFNRCCWFINFDSQPAALSHLPEWSLAATHFLCKAHHSLLAHRNMSRHFSPSLGAILNNKITNKKSTEMQKNVALNRLWKGQLLTVREPHKKASRAVCCLSWGCALEATQTLPAARTSRHCRRSSKQKLASRHRIHG